jgi:hypothetical protein
MATRSAPKGAANPVTQLSGDVSLLIRAITLPGPEAYQAWQKWRTSVDIDALKAEDFHVIPVLGDRLSNWLEDDPAAGVLRGILRRAWTETTLRLGAARAVASALEQAGCGPIFAAASLASCLLNRLPNSIRSLSDIRLAVRRGSLAQVAQVLQGAGWHLTGELPDRAGLDWCAAVHFSQPGLSLLVQWRLLPAPHHLAMALEDEFLLGPQSVDCLGIPLQAPGPERALLAALCGRHEFDADPVPWQVDAALLPLDRIDWSKWSSLADRFAPEAFDRLEQMRELGLVVPRIRRPAKPRPPRLRKLYLRVRGRVGRSVRYTRRAASLALRSLRLRIQQS